MQKKLFLVAIVLCSVSLLEAPKGNVSPLSHIHVPRQEQKSPSSPKTPKVSVDKTQSEKATVAAKALFEKESSKARRRCNHK